MHFKRGEKGHKSRDTEVLARVLQRSRTNRLYIHIYLYIHTYVCINKKTFIIKDWFMQLESEKFHDLLFVSWRHRKLVI